MSDDKPTPTTQEQQDTLKRILERSFGGNRVRVRNQLDNILNENDDIDYKVALLKDLRGNSQETESEVDKYILAKEQHMRQTLEQVKGNIGEAQAIIDKLTKPPLMPAVFKGKRITNSGTQALVSINGVEEIIELHPDISFDDLKPGQEVYLSAQQNVVLEISRNGMPTFGDTATFDRRTEDGRIVLKSHEGELVVDASHELANTPLKNGDKVRWDKRSWMAFELLERSKGEHLFLEDTPNVTFEQVGGLDGQILDLKRAIRMHVEHDKVAAKYKLPRKGSMLLVGPPGTGKTMMAKAIANWLAQISKSGRSRFINVKPGGLHSMWYGQSEANYREVFRVARAAGDEDPDVPIVMFFDEVDSIGMSRGGDASSNISDRMLTAFMAELDGLEERGNVLIVAATNRREAIDPALLRPGRLGDMIVTVPRPSREATESIFRKYLTPDLPYAKNGKKNRAQRHQEIIEAAVGSIWTSNQSDHIATVKLKGGESRLIRFKDINSGATISKIANAAIERACIREIETKEVGIRMEDILESVQKEFVTTADGLNIENIRRHLMDLPDGIPIAEVSIVRKS